MPGDLPDAVAALLFDFELTDGGSARASTRSGFSTWSPRSAVPGVGRARRDADCPLRQAEPRPATVALVALGRPGAAGAVRG